MQITIYQGNDSLKYEQNESSFVDSLFMNKTNTNAGYFIKQGKKLIIFTGSNQELFRIDDNGQDRYFYGCL